MPGRPPPSRPPPRQPAAQQAAAQQAAAEQEAARVEALSRDSHGGHTQVVGDVNLESVASLLDDEDDEDVGYGQIMVSMTRTHDGTLRGTPTEPSPARNGRPSEGRFRCGAP